VDRVVIQGENMSATELRTLYSWLSDRQELQGRVKLESQPVEPGKLGGTDVLAVAVSSGGAITALISGIVSWLRLRYSKRHPDTPVTLRIVRPNGVGIELSAPVASAWSTDELATQITRLAQILDGQAAEARAGGTQATGETAAAPEVQG
jgi:hypothetical protein